MGANLSDLLGATGPKGEKMGNKWTRVAALSGVVFVVLVVLGIGIGSGSPGTDAKANTIQHYYVTHTGRLGTSAVLSGISVAFGLFFFGYLRAYFRRWAGNEWLSSIFFGGAIIFGVGGALSAGLAFTLTDSPKSLSPGGLQVLNTLSSDLNWASLTIGMIIVFAALGCIIFRSRLVPMWLAWVSWLMAVLAASWVLSFVPLIGMGVWVLIASIRMAVRNPSIAPESSSERSGISPVA
jgi:MFS family permease